jgi:hypothetical protein
MSLQGRLWWPGRHIAHHAHAVGKTTIICTATTIHHIHHSKRHQPLRIYLACCCACIRAPKWVDRMCIPDVSQRM